MDDLRHVKNLLIFVSIIIGFATLYVARDLFLPIVIGLIAALTFSPVVRSFSRLGVPVPLSAMGIILGACVFLGLGSYLLSGPVSGMLADAPAMGVELKQKLKGILASLEDMKSASEEVAGIANAGDTTPVVAVQQPGLLAFAAGSIANFMALVLVGLILAFFILASGDLFYEKLVQAIPKFSDKRKAIKTAREIERQISHYFLTIAVINAGLGVSIGIAMYLVGLPNPVLWGALGFVLNFLPYVGAVIGALTVAAFGILSFDTLGFGILPAALYLTLTSLEAQFITPIVLGRRLEMNTVAVFLTVIIWSWLWSVPGALMAVPFLVIFKVICNNAPGLAVLGNFLSPRRPVDPG